MTISCKFPALASLAIATGLVCGCSVLGKPAPDASRYFVLASTDPDTAAARGRSLAGVHFGLGPVKMPGYLETQSLVRSGPGGSVHYVPTAYWAEPLAPGFSRALLHRTGTRLGSTHGVAYPWYSTTRIDWKVPVDVLRFEATADGHAVLVARWSVQRGSDSAAVAGAETVCDESAGADPAQIVSALSLCVDRLAEDITAGLAAAAEPRATVPKKSPAR
jgi:uncharacterized lipoprotein YmbA